MTSFTKKLLASMHNLTITMFDRPEEAPKYTTEDGWKAVTIDKAVIVGRGMESGKPTVDFQFTDEDGNKYIGMLIGDLVKGVASAVEGMHQRTMEQE